MCRDHAVKLLWVRCSPALRKTVLSLLPGYEFHHDNRSAWLVLEDAWRPVEQSWGTRATRLANDWDARRSAFASAGTPMPAPRYVVSGRGGELGTFHRTAAAVCASLDTPLTSYVLVMAPTWLEDPAAFADQLAGTMAHPELERLRYVVLSEPHTPLPDALLQALGPRALHCDCILDEAEQRRDLAAMLAPDRPEGVGMGAIPIAVKPPTRVGQREPLPPARLAELLRDAGVNPEYLAAAPEIRRLVFGAALAMKEGRGVDAVKQQRAARDRCAAVREPLVQVICQITLASYLSGLGMRESAIAELEAASRIAHENRLWLQLSQAHLALALLHALDQRLPAAIDAYTLAAHAAQRADAPQLAIEAWRLAGQLLLQSRRSEDSIVCFQRALAIASTATPEQRAESSAPEAARKLASLYEGRGQTAQAISLYAQADAYEAGAAESRA